MQTIFNEIVVAVPHTLPSSSAAKQPSGLASRNRFQSARLIPARISFSRIPAGMSAHRHNAQAHGCRIPRGDCKPIRMPPEKSGPLKKV